MHAGLVKLQLSSRARFNHAHVADNVLANLLRVASGIAIADILAALRDAIKPE